MKIPPGTIPAFAVLICTVAALAITLDMFFRGLQ